MTRRLLVSLLACIAAALALAPGASAAPLAGSSYDTGDGDQVDGVGLDWQGANAAGLVRESPDANDDCFVGGVKELAPNQWAFNSSAGGCTPGKSNVRVAFVNAESKPTTTFGHFGFLRNDTTGNTFLSFELNQSPVSWTNAAGTTIPCRSNGDLLLSFEVGGSSLTTILYKWVGVGSGPPACPNGASGTFLSSGPLSASVFQGSMNAATAITNYVNPLAYRSSFPANSFGEAAVDLPAALQAMGQSRCFGFLRMQVHSRSSSSIASAMIDYTNPIPVNLQSCAATGTAYQDDNGNGTRDAGEPPVAGFEFYADVDGDGVKDAGEPSGTSDATGFYRILNLPAGSFTIRQVPRAGWNCSQPSPCRYERSLPLGGNSTGNDFGLVAPSIASGTKFDDLDGDGVRDPGEPGLAGAVLYADYDDDNVRDAGEPSATSDAAGAWAIEDVAAGTYKIRESLQAGWTCSLPSPCWYTRTFASGSSATGLTFGNHAAATVGGNLFEDTDGDGAAKEAGEGNLAGWQVFLDANGNDAFDLGEQQTTTDAAGSYAFTGLTPGSYTIRATLPSATWFCTRPGSVAESCERTVVLTSGLTASGQDLGHARTGSISGTKFNDANNNGVKDGTEGSWTAGATIYVDYNGNGTFDAGEPSGAVTSGAWTITGVLPGSWTLREVSGAFTCTTPTPCTFAVTLASGQAAAGYAFGNYVNTQRGVSGTVFLDANANGVKDAAETIGVAGWTAYADDNKNGSLDTGESRSTTNAAGGYSVTFNGNGNVTVRLVPTAGWTCSYPSGCEHSFGLGFGQSASGKDFGVWGPAVISGTVRHDANANGVRDAGEDDGLAGRTVYVDANGNSAFDGGEANATTGAGGAYSLPGLPPGTYTVRFVPQAGYTCTAPSPCSWSVTLTGANVGGRDFLSHATGSIAGTVYEDADASGARDGGEAGVAGRTVYLDANANGARDAGETSAVTDGAGAYTLSGVAPGAHVVRQVLPGGWTQSAPAGGHAVTVASQAALTGRDFGSHTTGSISGVAFEDLDFDGSAYETGDPLLAGRTVYVDADGDGARDAGEPSATTDGAGAYAISGLAPGSHAVRTATPGGHACAYPADCSYAVTVASGATVTGRDFGSYLGATVVGEVFEDADADGAAREPGEAGLPGQRVFLDADGDGERDASEPTAVTDATGAYSLTGIVARSWEARIELGAGWTCDRPAPCRTSLSLTSGSTHAATDFGIHSTGSISGHLFTDRDNDGQPQVWGENDQPGRTVYLDADDDGTLDGGEPTATTDDWGDYTFTGLEPGTYRVRQVLPAGWTCSTPDPCERLITLVSRLQSRDNEFSSWTTASFSGTYFEDADADGAYPEPEEEGLAGRDVYLDLDLDGAEDPGEPVATSDADGRYAFSSLAPGTYVVRSAAPQPAGWTCSYPAPCATTLTLEAAEAAQDVDFGAWTSGTVAGTVRRAGGAGLGGWTVYADADGDAELDAGETVTTTDADGDYELTLTPGEYTVRELPEAGWSCASPDPCEHAVTVTSQAALTGRDFANQTTSVAGTVYEDADGDVQRDAGESGRPGVTVYVDADGDEARDAGEPSQTTDALGAYRFAGLAPGSHTVRAETPAGWLCLTAGCAVDVTVAPGDELTGRDVAIARPATIAGTAFEDGDGDGAALEPGEPGVAGRSIYVDADLDSTHDADEPLATTGADGAYALAGLAPGTYTVRQLAQAGWSCSYPAPCDWQVTVASGETQADRDFGGWRRATLQGDVFEDRDAGGTRDAGDDGRAGVDVWVDYDDDGEQDGDEPSAKTDATGRYAITGVELGTWRVRAAVGAAWRCSAPSGCARLRSLGSGEEATEQDFAIWTPGTVAGELYDDADGDGAARDAGDAPLSENVWLDLDGDDVQDGGETATSSAATGAYAFSGVAPGTYALRATLPGRTCSRPATCERTVTVTSGAELGGRDFGGWQHAEIAGRLTDDLDGDGTVDAGEPALEGHAVVLDVNDNGAQDAGEPVRSTSATGTYAFADLRPGAHAVVHLPPAGRDCTAPASCRHHATLASGQSANGWDFSSRKRAAPAPPPPAPPPPAAPAPPPPAAPQPKPTRIAGTVFEDRDADGREREHGEPGLAGWTVYADLDSNGRRGATEPAARTDARGAYELRGLAPGAYALAIVLPSDKWVCSLPAACVRRVPLASGAQVTGRDFAGWRTSKLTGMSFEDRDRDGSAREAGDAPLSGWKVYVDVNGNGRLDAGEPYDTTDETGRYGVTNIPLGTYTVRQSPPPGSEHRCTFPVGTCATRATFTAAGEERVADFGSVLGIQRARGRAALRTPASCRSGRFRVRVAASLARKVVLRVDGRRRGASTRPSAGRYRFTLDARRHRQGIHAVAVKVTFLDGTVRTLRSTFYRCRSAVPTFTG